MRIFAIDDERPMLEELHEAIHEAVPQAQILDFMRVRPALEAIEGGVVPDVVFSDIALPGMDGIMLAKRIREVAPAAKIVFVTAYPNYAVDAYRMHAQGFVVKPVDAMRVREELDALFGPGYDEGPRLLRVRCFGVFEVFVGDEPLTFSRTRTKELLACLVDHRGHECTGADIIDALWPRRRSTRSARSYLRVLTQDLRSTLAAAGVGDVLVRGHDRWAVRAELLDCDYYRALAGDEAAIRAYGGEYLSQYGWAESTKARLQSRYRD